MEKFLWVIFSYNLFFSLGYQIYTLSHSLMVHLSSQDSSQRDSLSMLSSAGTGMIPGILATLVLPLLISRIGVGSAASENWLMVMGTISILAIPGALVEYYFTKERVEGDSFHRNSNVSYLHQIRTCLKSRKWVSVMLFMFIYYLCSNLSAVATIYYCNWTIGDSIVSGSANQILINAIGQAPMGLGVFILWPLVNKFGKTQITRCGFLLASLGSLMILLTINKYVIVARLLIRSVGLLPIYTFASFLADAIDEIERRHGFRADGFTSSIFMAAQTISSGLGQTIILLGTSLSGYIIPDSATQVITQPQAVQNFFALCFAGLPMAGYLLCFLILKKDRT